MDANTKLSLFEDMLRLQRENERLEVEQLSQSMETDLGRCESVKCDGFYRAQVTITLREEFETEEEAKRAAARYFITADKAYRPKNQS